MHTIYIRPKDDEKVPFVVARGNNVMPELLHPYQTLSGKSFVVSVPEQRIVLFCDQDNDKEYIFKLDAPIEFEVEDND